MLLAKLYRRLVRDRIATDLQSVKMKYLQNAVE